MKFTIIFMGLIAQIGLHTNTDQLAVFVNSKHPIHQAILRVNPADIETGTTPTFKRVTTNCPAGEICYDLQKEHVTLVGAPGTGTRLSNSFRKHVPQLSKITDASNSNGSQKVKDAIRKGTSHRNTTGYLKYVGGELSVDQVWCTEVRFEPQLYAPDAMCVAHEVIYTSEPFSTEFVELKSKSGKSIRLRANATVHVENLPVTDPAIPHYHHMKDILDNVAQMGTMIPTGRKCDQPEDRPTDRACVPGTPGPAAAGVQRTTVGRAVDYECTASQFP